MMLSRQYSYWFSSNNASVTSQATGKGPNSSQLSADTGDIQAVASYKSLVARMLEPHKTPEKQRWLPGARLNIAECALTGWDPDAPALLWAAEGFPDRLHSLTLDQLRRRCYSFAASLRSCGYRPGDGYPKVDNGWRGMQRTHTKGACLICSARMPEYAC